MSALAEFVLTVAAVLFLTALYVVLMFMSLPFVGFTP